MHRRVLGGGYDTNWLLVLREQADPVEAGQATAALERRRLRRACKWGRLPDEPADSGQGCVTDALESNIYMMSKDPEPCAEIPDSHTALAVFIYVLTVVGTTSVLTTN